MTLIKIGLLCGMLFLAGCANTTEVKPSSFPGTPTALAEESEASINLAGSFCADLEKQVLSRGDVPLIAQCNEDTDSTTGDKAILVTFEDPSAFLIEQDIDVSFESVFAPLEAVASSYGVVGDESLSSYELFLLLFEDECGTGWEVKPDTLAKLSEREVTLEQAMGEVDIYSTPNCP